MGCVIEEKAEGIVYKLTKCSPEEFTPENIHLSDLTISLFSFLYEHFRGSLSMNFSGEPFGSINICPRGIAYLVKLILIEACGKSLVKINFISTQRKFTVEILHNLGERDFSFIMKIAKLAGFDIEIYKKSRIVISTKVFPDKRPAFYNNKDNYLTNIIAYVFSL